MSDSSIFSIAAQFLSTHSRAKCCCCYLTPSKRWGHGAPETRQLPRVWTTNCRKTESRQRVSSWTVQNEMKGVLGRVSTGTARRILDSANPREIRAVRCSKNGRGHSEWKKQAQVFHWKTREPVCQRISMRQYTSSSRKDKSTRVG